MKIKNLQLLCNKNIINNGQTTAPIMVGGLTEKEIAFKLDEEWEGEVLTYTTIVHGDGVYRMYYQTRKLKESMFSIRICYAESKDGINWVKPKLNICTYNGSSDNNIILDKSFKPSEKDFFDNFFVFKDDNSKCKKGQRYKALVYKGEYRLECFFSEDGIHFERGYEIDMEGKFDTLNTCRWDDKRKRYVAYVRNFHDVKDPKNLGTGKRDFRMSTSKDFKNWTTPKLVNFIGMREDYQMYTNNIMPYPRNKDIYVGFPVRYIERKEWTPNYDELCGKEYRLERIKRYGETRLGLALTDCLFMISDDGFNWYRYDQALITPGIEKGNNWLYGNCYPSYALIDNGDTFSMLMPVDREAVDGAKIRRFEIRKDGFAYYQAGDDEKKVVLKTLIYEGKNMYINFSTSAAGYVFIDIEDYDGNKITTCEMFGDSIERKACFIEDEVQRFSGKKVKITFRIKDAKIYAFEFKD